LLPSSIWEKVVVILILYQIIFIHYYITGLQRTTSPADHSPIDAVVIDTAPLAA